MDTCLISNTLNLYLCYPINVVRVMRYEQYKRHSLFIGYLMQIWLHVGTWRGLIDKWQNRPVADWSMGPMVDAKWPNEHGPSVYRPMGTSGFRPNSFVRASGSSNFPLWEIIELLITWSLQLPFDLGFWQ